MDIEMKHGPSYSLAVVTLEPNEQIKTEAGAMVGHSDGITTETKSQGGFFGGLKRMVGGESFFQNTWTASSSGGQIMLAPALPGDMRVLDIDSDFMLQSGAYIASEDGVETNTKWGGARGFFGSGTLILLQVSGRGKLLLGCYGAIEERELAAGEKFTVDTGHVVGFSGGMGFEVRKVGGWKSTFLSGEGLVVDLTGPGRLLMQTRSEEALINWIIPQVPQQTN